MTKLFYAATSIFILVLTFSFSYAKVPEIVLKQKRAVVTIYINDKDGNQIASGTGFIVESNGIIATNYHVISKWLEADNTLLVKMENGAFFPLRALIDFDEENDIAIFKVDGKELPFIKLAKDYKPKQGDKIVVVGSPLGLETTVSDGIISSVRGKGGVLQITAPISQGSSGSPVLNSSGDVIGVATFLMKGGQNLNFAIPVKHVATLLKKALVAKKKGINEPWEIIPDAPAPAPAPASAPEPPEINTEKADALFTAKNYKEALSEYLKLWSGKSSNPQMSYITLQIGQCHIEMDNDMLGLSWLKYVLKEYPNAISALVAKNIISTKRWFSVGRTDRTWFIDVSSITSIDKNLFRAFVKTVYWERNKLYSDVTNDVFDCALGRSAAVGLIKYDPDGKVISSYDFTDNLQWNSVSPNSIGESLWNTVCGKE